MPLLLLYHTVPAQDLSLKDALQYALQHYTAARKAKLEVENSAYKIQETRAAALPEVSASGGLTYNPLLQLSAIPAELSPTGSATLIAFGQKWNSNAGVSLSQKLFDQSVFTGLKATKATREYYLLAQQQTEEQVLEQVATAYYQVLAQRQKVAVVDSNIRTTTEMQRIIKGQYESGLAKRIDADRVAVNLNNLNSQRRQLLSEVSLKENQLKFYMGLPIQTPIIISQDALVHIVPRAIADGDSAVVTQRSDYLVLLKQAELLKFQKQATEAAYYPSLSLAGNYSYQRLSNSFPFGKSGPSSPGWFDVASVGLNLKVPIFSGGGKKAKVRQADIDVRKLQEDITDVKQSLNLAYENARSQINNSILTLNTQEANVQLAQAVFNDTQNNYNQGLATLTDLLDARNDLTEAQNNYTGALLDYKLAEIQMIKSKGQIKSLLN
ncbi:TolC family protein [Filimonas effusa]|uniref:TolC family protein n=2 Tax=Filimonas effusa TaxID=2508721 RepID=A0A4Q1D5Y5_9BACT|nr:TolC family protein [Filimonas effusa]